MDVRQRRLQDLNNAIVSLQSSVLLSPRSNPLRTRCIQDLAMAKFERSLLSRQQDDLEQSILSFAEAILLQQPRLPDQKIVPMFYHFALALFFHAKESRQPNDVKFCIMCLRYLHRQWHEIPSDIPLPLSTFLVRALAIQMEVNPGSLDLDVEEMADLCDELLVSDIPMQFLTNPIMALASVVPEYLAGFTDGQIGSEKVINCLRKAAIRRPDLHIVPVTLAMSLVHRFLLTPSDDDFKEGMANFDKVINFCGPGDGPSPYRDIALQLAALLAQTQFVSDERPEHMEQAIRRYRSFLGGAPFENPSALAPLHAINTEGLSSLERRRFNDPVFSTDSQSALPNTRKSDNSPSFRDLTASLPELNTAKPLPSPTRWEHFNALLPSSIKCLTDIADVKDGLNYCRQLLVSYPLGEFARHARLALIYLFHRAFELLNQIEYLDEAISAARDNIDTADLLMYRVASLQNLVQLLQTRLVNSRRREDFNELMQLFPMAATHENIPLVNRFVISCQWGSAARVFRHDSTSTAYDHAMSSMQAFLTFAPTLDLQHSRLVAISDELKTVSLDYASYQIQGNRLEQAIETLERGRVLLWSEMRGLRTSIDQIRLADPDAADRFSALNKDLEKLTLAFSPLARSGIDGGNNVELMDPYSDLVTQQRKLLDDREKLISQIRSLPGLDTFMKGISFDDLRSAASHGPVIILNHSKWRSDIIILLHNSLPSLVPTSDDFYDRAKKLQDQLLGARRDNKPGSHKYEDALRSVLNELYELVGRPVIKRLNELNVPKQSRVWWCPTSVFCSLPLHAMGPIPSDEDTQRYFLDLYIPSYVPSLSALLESRKPGLETITKPSLLLVAHPDEKMPKALKEMKVVQDIDTPVTTLFSKKATCAAVLACLKDHQFAHLVCHGELEPGKPFESWFKLHKGKRLQLLDIVRSQLPRAEFAFLSACHTAELTKESISDEVLHLAAAMQFCGFRSVVGTMWAMLDADGRDLVTFFYTSVFSDDWRGVPYYERTAKALRDAVVKLRKKKKADITLERWVNYVHYGA